MFKSITYLILSCAIAFGVMWWTEFSIPVSAGLLNTLYAVAGVIFSVGMTIAISPKTEDVTQIQKRQIIRREYRKIRNAFIVFFTLDTTLFIISGLNIYVKLQKVASLTCLIFVLISIGYFICNFIALQKLGDDIEDHILKERQNASR